MQRLVLLAAALYGASASAEDSLSTGSGAGPALWHSLVADRLEFRVNDGDDLFHVDVTGGIGGDTHRLWAEVSGDSRTEGPWGGEAEVQLMYGRAITPSWELRAGARQDVFFGAGPDHERTFASLGAIGTAPLGIELQPMLFVSDEGDVSLRLTGVHALRVAPRLVARSFVEVELAVHDAEDFGVRRGFSDLELGLRVRYEVLPEIGPFVGVSWLRRLGTSADLTRDAGGDVGVVGLVGGLWVSF